MNVEDRLLAAMLECGLSESRARIRAIDFAAAIAPELERERRDRAIRDLLPTVGAEVVAIRYGIHRSTAYRALQRKSQKNEFLATNRP